MISWVSWNDDDSPQMQYLVSAVCYQILHRGWEDAQEALKLMGEVSKYSTSVRMTSLVTWFNLPN